MTLEAANAILSAVNPRTVLYRGWHLDGAGPARYGWAYRHPCKVEFVGRTIVSAIVHATYAVAAAHDMLAPYPIATPGDES